MSVNSPATRLPPAGEVLVIELDGSQHIQQTVQDSERTQYLQARGYRVLRFWNDQVLNDIDGVIAVIQQALAEP